MEKDFDELFRLYSNDIYRLAYSYVLNKSDAEDIVQKTFYKLYKNIKRISRSDNDVKRWLFRVAINESKDLLKSFGFKNSRYHIEEDKLCNQALDKEDFLVSLELVSEKYRVPLYLFYYEGYSVEEIAKILNKSISAIKMRISRGKEQLRKEINQNERS